MRQRGGVVRRHRAAIAANVALAVTACTVVAYAVSADGYETHRADLNDGGIWVTSNVDGIFGRINKPIGQADGAMYADRDDDLDIAQQGAAVVGINLTDNLLTSIDPRTVQPVEGEEATIPPGARVVMAGGSLAVVDSASGAVWAQRIDPTTGQPAVSSLAEGSEPLAQAGESAAVTVTVGGTVLTASAETDEVLRLEAAGEGYADPAPVPIGVDLSSTPTMTSVGERGVVLDSDTGELVVIGGATAALPPGAALQQPGPSADSVLVATRAELLAVNLDTGEASPVAQGLSGRPTAPVRLGACEYAAWSGGRGAVVTACGDAEPRISPLRADATDLVFRVNRDQILLNDRASGAVWDLDSDKPARIDDWDAFEPEIDESDQEKDEQDQDDGDRQPPKAKPDDLGARPGRITVLHPLDNDTAPSGRILAIRSVGEVSGPGQISVGPDGQTVQVRLPADAVGSTRFSYVIDDGREDVSDSAAVEVRTRDLPANGEPDLRPGYRQRDWVVPSGGTLDVPVLPDWRDPRDGDPLSLVSAVAVGGDRSGAVARTTAAGRVRLTAPVDAGVVGVEYVVSDGTAEVTRRVDFRVQDKLDTTSFAAVAEPDIVSGETGKQIVIKPLGNDLPGTDPLTPEATLELAGKVAATGGADVRTDLVEGTITFRSTTARTFLLDYDAAYGSAPIAGGRIRVDVHEPVLPVPDPVAMPDQVTVFGQAATMVDVLANDVDPTGGMLVVQRAVAGVDNQLDVAVVQGRWVRISARQGELAPNPQTIRYTISNGVASGIEGEVTVSQRPLVADNTPVTQTDRVVVRAGTSITVPVLDNDYSPSGDQLRLVNDVSGEMSGQLKVQAADGTGEAGSAFVSGRLVRFVAPVPDSTGTDGADSSDVTNAQVRYLATNEAGQTSPGRLEITVVPTDRRNQAPEPPQLEGRTVAGDTVKLRLPGVGVDPDGDAVTLLGISSAPSLGRIVTYGANSLEYQAYPGSGGTDEFQYRVVDSFGEPAIGTARVAVVPGGLPQPPLAVSDTVSVAPGSRATVDVMANDLIAPGDRVTVELAADPPPGVRLASETGPVLIDAPDRAGGRNVDVVYRLGNGIATSQATITVRAVKDYNNPPIVYDAFGAAEDADTVSVDVLETAYDPDGAAEDLRVTDVYVPAGSPAGTIDDGTITVARGEEPTVVPFRIEDGDGGAATASLYVPARGRNLPFVRGGALIRLAPGESVRARLADYIVNPAGGPVAITVPDRVRASPGDGIAASANGKGSVTVQAGRRYAGPGAVVVEVTTATSAADPAGNDGLVSMLSIPVQVGETKPILSCPAEPIVVAQGESVQVPVAAQCHVWTVDAADAEGLSFDAEWDEPLDGLTAEAQGGFIEVSAAQGTERDTRAVLAVSADGSDPGLIRFVVTGGPPPSLAPMRVSDMKAGQSRVFDLAPYFRPGVSDPEPTVLEASQVTGLDIDVDILNGSQVRFTTGADVSGAAEFRVVMSDVPREDADADRRVEGRISLDVLDVPDAPAAPVPGNSVVSQQVSLTWGEPDANGAPIDYYEVRSSGAATRRCAATACEISGLTNGRTYTFQVRAHNAVGFSDWSGSSRGATPDAKPGLVGPISNSRVADRTLVIRWSAPDTSATLDYYVVTWAGGSRQTSRPEAVITGLNNNLKYSFKVYAVNDVGRGPVRTSKAWQSQGPIGLPQAPTIVDTPSSASTATLTVSWPPVPPNGPGPVAYRLLRNGATVAGCEGLQSSCSIPGVVYDGSRSEFAVVASVGRDPGQQGPAREWFAVGNPDAWGAWTADATGTDATARLAFTVPEARGTASTVALIVDGRVVKEYDARGPQVQNVSVGTNDGPHSVALRVCNENSRCSQSDPKQVQAYGPLRPEHLMSITPEKSGAQLRWVITVDTNGNDAELRVSSPERDQVLSAPGVDVQTLATEWVDIGFGATETVTVALSDAAPDRGQVQATATGTSEPPPPPTVTVVKGPPCSDADGSTNACQQSPSNPECVEATCAFVEVRARGWRGQFSCTINNSADGVWWLGNTQTRGGDGDWLMPWYFRTGVTTATCSDNLFTIQASVQW